MRDEDAFMLNVDGKSRQTGDIEEYLNLNLKMLSCIGFNISLRARKAVEQNKLLKKIPALFAIAMALYAVIYQLMLIRESIMNHQYLMTMEVSSHLITNMLCLLKVKMLSLGFRLVTAIKELNTVLWELIVFWRKYVPRHKKRDNILNKAANTLSFCKIFVAVTFSAVMSFGLPSLQKLVLLYVHRNNANYTIDYSQRVFFMKYPFEINSAMTYFYVILEEEYLLLACALFWICGDTFFAQLTMHASLQFEILRHDVDSLINAENSDLTLKKNFVTFISRHIKLLRVCDRIEHIYSPIVLITVLMSSVNICLNIFELSKAITTGQYVVASLHCFVLINTFLQIVFYCVFAETLTEQSRALGDAIYYSRWTDKNYKLRVYIHMFIIKCQNPFYCTAYGFFPIGHKRLTMVLNTAFSYYMILRTTK